MKLYQLTYRCHIHGSRTLFAANKRDADEKGKELFDQSEREIEVSTVEVPTRKAELIEFLNKIEPVYGHYSATHVKTMPCVGYLLPTWRDE